MRKGSYSALHELNLSDQPKRNDSDLVILLEQLALIVMSAIIC